MPFSEKRFARLIEDLIKFKSGTTKVPIKDTSWEELIWATLVFMYGDAKVNWDSQSHEKSVDIKAEVNGSELGISAKGGVIKNGILSISSYRLTTFDDLQSKLDFIRNEHKRFSFYLICAREEDKKNQSLNYNVFKVNPHKLAPSSMLSARSWTQVKSGFELTRNVGFKARIVSKMSHQLWYAIPLEYFVSEEKLLKLSIPLNTLGKGLLDFLNRKRATTLQHQGISRQS